MAIGGNEALAGDVIGDLSSSLGAEAYGFAGELGARYGDFGAYRELSSYGLTDRIHDRWSMPDRLTNGIELFDTGAMDAVVRDWSSSSGYWDVPLTDAAPFVIPVDPVANVRGLSARRARQRSGRRRSMFAIPAERDTLRQRSSGLRSRPQGPRAPSVKNDDFERRIEQPVERWRALDETQLTPYPKAMGRAGAVDATLLKFADARARVQRGDRTAIVASPSPTVDWSPGDGLAPAARGAELILDDLIHRISPSPAAPVTHWLVPADAPADVVEQIVSRHVSAAPSRWMQMGSVPIAPITTPRPSQRTLDGPAGVLIDPGVMASGTVSPEGDATGGGDAPSFEQQLSPRVMSQPPSTRQVGTAVPPMRTSTSRFMRPLVNVGTQRMWPPLPKAVMAAGDLSETVLAGATRWSTTALDTGLGLADDILGVGPAFVAGSMRDLESTATAQTMRARFDAPSAPWDRAGVLLNPAVLSPTPRIVTSGRIDAVADAGFAGSGRTAITQTVRTDSAATTPAGRAAPGRVGDADAGPVQLSPTPLTATTDQVVAAGSAGQEQPTSALQGAQASTLFAEQGTAARVFGAYPQLHDSRVQSNRPRPIVAMLERLLGRWTKPDQTQPVIAAAARTVSRILNQLIGAPVGDESSTARQAPTMDLYTETGAFVLSPPSASLGRLVDSAVDSGELSVTPTAVIPEPAQVLTPPLISQVAVDPRLTAGGGVMVSNDVPPAALGPNLPSTVQALLAAQGVDLESPWITWVDRIDAKLNNHFGSAGAPAAASTSSLVDQAAAGTLVQPTRPSISTSSSAAVESDASDTGMGLSPRRPAAGSPGQKRRESSPRGRAQLRAQATRRVQGPLVSPARGSTPQIPGPRDAGAAGHRLLRRRARLATSLATQSTAGDVALSASSPSIGWSPVGRVAELGHPSSSSDTPAVDPYAGWPTHLIEMVESYGASDGRVQPRAFDPATDFGFDADLVAQSTAGRQSVGDSIGSFEPFAADGVGPARRLSPPRTPGATAMAVLDLSTRLTDERPQMGLSHGQPPAPRGVQATPGYADELGSTLVKPGSVAPPTRIPTQVESAESGSGRRPASARSAMDVLPVTEEMSFGSVRSISQGLRPRRVPGQRRARSAFGQPMGLTIPLGGPRRRSVGAPSTMDVISLVSKASSPVESRAPRRLAALWAAAVEATKAPQAAGPSVGGGQGRPEWATVQMGRVDDASVARTEEILTERAVTSMVTPDNVSRALVAYGKAFEAAGGGAGSPGRVGAALNRAGRHVDSGRPRTKPKAPMSFVESPRTPGKLFGDRGPAQVKAPQDKSRVMVDIGQAEQLTEAMMRSTGAELSQRPETADQVRHRLAGDTEGDLSPEEIEQIADEVITMLRREAEFDRLILGDDEWD